MEKLNIICGDTTRPAIEKSCDYCSKKYLTRKSQPTKCCSIECKYSLIKSKRFDFVCAQCGINASKPFSKSKNSKSGLHFCSRICKDIAQRIGGIKEIMPPHYGTSDGRQLCKKWISENKDLKCVGCGELKKYLLSVHHIDGKHDNNVESNFEIVCANCHIKRHLKFTEVGWIYSTRSLTPRDKLLDL